MEIDEVLHEEAHLCPESKQANAVVPEEDESKPACVLQEAILPPPDTEKEISAGNKQPDSEVEEDKQEANSEEQIQLQPQDEEESKHLSQHSSRKSQVRLAL